MTITFKPSKRITIAELFDGTLNDFGIRERVVEGHTASDYRCLTNDRGNSLWVFGDTFVEGFAISARNGFPLVTLFLIETLFDLAIYLDTGPELCTSEFERAMEDWMVQYWEYDCGRGGDGVPRPGYSIEVIHKS